MRILIKNLFSLIKEYYQRFLNKNLFTVSDALTVFLIAFLIICLNFQFLSQFTLIGKNDVIFEADTHDSAKSTHNVIYNRDMWKHLLFSATLSPIRNLIENILTTSLSRSIVITFSILSAFNVMGVFLLLKKIFSSTRFVSLLTGVYTFFFSNLVLFSIPETYSLSNLMILIYLSILICVYKQLNWLYSFILSIISGIAALYNPPLFSLIIIHLFLLIKKLKFRDWILLVISNLLIGLIIFFSIYYQIHGNEFIPYLLNYSNKWASLENFLYPKKILTVLVNFFFFSILSPVNYLPNRLGWGDFLTYLKSPIGVCLFFFIFCLLCSSVYFVLTKKTDTQRLLISFLIWISMMFLFYIYFNPEESLLYSSQILLPLILIMANAFEDLKSKPNLKYAILLILFVLLGINNTLALYSGPAN